MRITLTRYGLPQIMSILGLILVCLGGVIWLWGTAWAWLIGSLGAFFIILLAFFRDPHREIPQGKGLLLAPADGKITDITELDTAEFIDGPALRIGIFLSVLDVHINRSPCAGTVKYIQRHHGKCINALHWKEASEKNEALSMGLQCPSHPVGKVMIKQITGAIARRIVCGATLDQKLQAGEKYGMIKFGSRTELFIPAAVLNADSIKVKTGQTVRAGSTILAELPLT